MCPIHSRLSTFYHVNINDWFLTKVDMTHCYDLMKEKAVLESLDTGAEKRWIQEERRHHANMMKENEEWNQEVRAGVDKKGNATSRVYNDLI